MEVPGETDGGEQEGTASLGHRTGPLHGGPQETAREPEGQVHCGERQVAAWGADASKPGGAGPGC